MDINFEKGVVTLYEKNIKLEPLIKRLSLLSGEQVYHFLSNRGIQIPRAFNCYALISVLNQRIKLLNSKSLSKDYFQRLQYYKYFTEQQLFNLFRKICNDEQSFYLYRYNFFKLILVNFVSMNLNDGEITYLKNLKKGKLESFEEYFNYISSASLEQEGSFDGRSIEELKAMLPLSASNQDIFDLAGKYGIDLPSRLKKKQFLDFIIYYMKKNNDYNDAIGEELEAMTVANLTTYARRTGIPMQAAMSKNDLITYLFYYLEQCEIDYTSIKRVELTPEFEPLSFTIDFSLINNFQSDDAVRVIHYEGEENDIIEANEMVDEDIEDEEVEENTTKKAIEEPTVEPLKLEDTIEAIEEPTIEASSDEEVVEADSELASTDEVIESANEPLNQDIENDEIIDDSIASSSDIEDEINIDEINADEINADEINADEINADEINADDIANEAINELESGLEAAEEYDDDFEVQYVAEEYINSTDDEASLDEEPIEKLEATSDSKDQAIDEAADEISDEEIQAIIDEHTKENNSSEENKKDEASSKELNLEVSKNDEYGNQKLMKLAKGKGKVWAITISIVIVLAILGAIAYLYFFNK